jgi:hypothetical protein
MESDKDRFPAKVLPLKNRIAELSIGLSVSNVLEYVFDYFLYPFVIFSFGILKGGIAMTLLSFIACYLTIKFYDWSKRDWLGIEAIKEIKNYSGNNYFRRITAWLMKKSEPIVFSFLSIKFNPFITTAYFRDGKFTRMTKRDWSIFIASLLIGNAYWTLACYMGITLVEWG